MFVYVCVWEGAGVGGVLAKRAAAFSAPAETCPNSAAAPE